jgi:hypothetical protein
MMARPPGALAAVCPGPPVASRPLCAAAAGAAGGRAWVRFALSRLPDQVGAVSVWVHMISAQGRYPPHGLRDANAKNMPHESPAR